jgi:hypothetical protein
MGNRWMSRDNLQERVLAAGYPHCEHNDFWMWYDERPQRLQIVWVLLRRFPKLDVPFVYKRKRKIRVSKRKVKVGESCDEFSFVYRRPTYHLDGLSISAREEREKPLISIDLASRTNE